jgi:hypothetical protein
MIWCHGEGRIGDVQYICYDVVDTRVRAALEAAAERACALVLDSDGGTVMIGEAAEVEPHAGDFRTIDAVVDSIREGLRRAVLGDGEPTPSPRQGS